MNEAPTRFTIRPHDYHVPYAGTAEDGRKFFLSEELFSDDGGWVGLFLWKADGTFDDVRVNPAERDQQLPPGQAGPAGSDRVAALLAELGEYRLEPITVEPFIQAATVSSSVGARLRPMTGRTSSTSNRVTSSATTRLGMGTSTTPDRSAA